MAHYRITAKLGEGAMGAPSKPRSRRKHSRLRSDQGLRNHSSSLVILFDPSTPPVCIGGHNIARMREYPSAHTTDLAHNQFLAAFVQFQFTPDFDGITEIDASE